MTEAELIEEVARLKAELKTAKVEKFNLFLELLIECKFEDGLSYLEYILHTDPSIARKFKNLFGGLS